MVTTRLPSALVVALGLLISVLPSAAQRVTATVFVGAQPSGIAINDATNKIYVPAFGSNVVTVIDGSTNYTVNIQMDQWPAAVAVNPVTNKAYIPDANYDVYVIDGDTYRTLQIPAGPTPLAAVVNSVTNRIYAANQDDATVTVIDGATNSTQTVNVGLSPLHLAVNSVTNKVYVANFHGDTVTAIDGATNLTTTINVGHRPYGIAVNPVTNKIYVANRYDNTVTVIDGATNSTTVINVGGAPNGVAINPATNLIYVTNYGDGTVTVIDGATGSTNTVSVGASPIGVAVNPTRNKIYVANSASNTATVIDGTTNSTVTLGVGAAPLDAAVNTVTGAAYVTNYTDGTVSVIDGAPQYTGLRLVTTPAPCRVVDTRLANGPFGGPPIQGGTYRDFVIPSGDCYIPSYAAAYSMNVTVVPHGALGYLTIWPTGQNMPLVSTLNSLDGRIKANATITPAGDSGAVSIFATNTTDVILDINGYFEWGDALGNFAFYPLPPCRVLDTRGPEGPLGGPDLKGGQPRDFPVQSSNCNIPSRAKAYSLNFTVVPRGPLGYLTVWPQGWSQPLASTLNAPTAAVTANPAIVQGGPVGGKISAYATNDTDLIADINGYFAPPDAPNPLSLYAVTPCRVLDTRAGGGAFSGELVVNVGGSPCAPPNTAQAFVLNATVVPLGSLGYLTLWADMQQRPLVSTLNALDGWITSNMAVVPTTNGKIDAYASSLTQLVLDIFSYFAP